MQAVYIHIPFCENICSYCDFSKFFYKEDLVHRYLECLEQEVKNRYQQEKIKTLYIGGGTPSCLSDKELKQLLEITKLFIKDEDIEFTVECNIENITLDKLKLFKDYGVNRISVGVQTFCDHHLKFLNRHHTKEMVFEKIRWMKEFGFKNINMDLMYALPNQTLKELKEDIENFLFLDLPHLSTYSLIIEPHTMLDINGVENIDEDLDEEMYHFIIDTLKEHNFVHYETSNFARKGYESKHNLTYWNNMEYYGFGVGASGYENGVRYNNTRSLNSYFEGNIRINEESLTLKEKMEEEMFLGLRKLEGVSKTKFKEKYKQEITDVFNISDVIEKGLLVDDGNYIFIPERYQYISNQILINFIGDSNE